MITVTPFEQLGTFKNEWLDAHYHFSFANYHDPERMGLGPLRVWNDDTIEAKTGFDPHPHRDMEIITYVRKGSISHEDSMGNKGVTAAGDIQVMSAGTGIVHSERNDEEGPVTVFQIWIMTDAKGHTPRWDARQFPKNNVSGELPVLASGRTGENDALMIHQDASLSGGVVTAGDSITHEIGDNRGVYLVPTEGSIKVNGIDVPLRAGVMVRDEKALFIEAVETSEIVLVNVPL
jgi:redox-sensitive bicupin YhaK (pirin superfamily)